MGRWRAAFLGLAVVAGISFAGYLWRISPAQDPSGTLSTTASPSAFPNVSRSTGQTELCALTAATDVQRPLADGERHRYRVVLEAGDALHVVVIQQNVDAIVTLFDFQGESWLTVDGPNGPDGPESLAVVASAAGEYLLEVSAATGAAGSYRLQVEALAPAGDGDRARAAGVELYARAERLRKEQTAASLRAALVAYGGALDQLRQAGEALLEARTQRRIGQVLIARGDPESALQHFEQALGFFQHHGNDWERVPLYTDAGRALRRVGEPDRARELFERAIAVAGPLGHDSAVAAALDNLGVLHASLGEMQQALAYYDRSLELWQRLGNHTKQATVLHNLGVHYVSLGRLEEGLDYLDQALAASRETGDLSKQAAALGAIGWVRDIEEDFDAAFATYGEALRLQRAVGDEQGESVTLDQRGTLYLRAGRYDEALEFYNQALRLVEGNRLDKAHSQVNLGSVHLAMGRPQAAIEPLQQALQTFRETGTLTGQVEALAVIARRERQLGRSTAARRNLQEALEIIESVRGHLQSRWLRTSYRAVKQDLVGAYVDLLMQMEAEEPGAGHAARAFEASERARARALLESLTEARASVRSAAAPELLDRERRLRAKINAAEDRRIELLAKGSVELAADLERELRSLLLDYEKVHGEISAGGPRSLHELRTLGLEQIQQEVLDDGDLLLAYTLDEERSFLWVVDRDTLAYHVLPPRSQIDELAHRAHELMPRSHRQGFQRQASVVMEELSAVLLGPVAAKLAGKRLLILADGGLHYVPFAALPVPRTGDRIRPPLLVDHEIVYLPSASVLALLRRELAERRPAPGLLAVVADPVFQADDPRLAPPAPGAEAGPKPARAVAADLERTARDFATRFERLPYAGVEAEAILALAAPAESFQATGLEATRELVLSGRLDRYRIVHFATHGLLNSAHPALSGIALSLVDEAGRPRDGLLRVHEIFDLPLSADLVVLSGCRTALGKRVRGEGLIGLTHGFFYAGAARLVVSFWNVDDHATAELMTRFYRGMLNDGLAPAPALRSAQLSMLDGRWRAPYYWAGFALHGEWR